jgi:hypothetical protein
MISVLNPREDKVNRRSRPAKRGNYPQSRLRSKERLFAANSQCTIGRYKPRSIFLRISASVPRISHRRSRQNTDGMVLSSSQQQTAHRSWQQERAGHSSLSSFMPKDEEAFITVRSSLRATVGQQGVVRRGSRAQESPHPRRAALMRATALGRALTCRRARRPCSS